ncbi:MAG: hypothetical protein AAF590_13715, partial [Pseudomonadota bacterium]
PSKAQFATMPVLVVSMYFGVLWHERFQDPVMPLSEIAVGATEAGGFSTRWYLSDAETRDDQPQLRLEFSSDQGVPLVQSIQVELWNGTRSIASYEPVRVRGLRQTVYVGQHVSQLDLERANLVQANVTFLNGEQSSFQSTLELASPLASSR